MTAAGSFILRDMINGKIMPPGLVNITRKLNKVVRERARGATNSDGYTLQSPRAIDNKDLPRSAQRLQWSQRSEVERIN